MRGSAVLVTGFLVAVTLLSSCSAEQEPPTAMDAPTAAAEQPDAASDPGTTTLAVGPQDADTGNPTSIGEHRLLNRDLRDAEGMACTGDPLESYVNFLYDPDLSGSLAYLTDTGVQVVRDRTHATGADRIFICTHGISILDAPQNYPGVISVLVDSDPDVTGGGPPECKFGDAAYPLMRCVQSVPSFVVFVYEALEPDIAAQEARLSAFVSAYIANNPDLVVR